MGHKGVRALKYTRTINIFNHTYQQYLESDSNERDKSKENQVNVFPSLFLFKGCARIMSVSPEQKFHLTTNNN